MVLYTCVEIEEGGMLYICITLIKMKRNLWMVFLVFVSIFLIACGNKNKTKGETFTYELSADESEYYLTKYEGSKEEVVIPEEYLNKKVTKVLEYAFKNTGGLKTLTISKNIEFIGKNVLENSTVEKVVFAEGIKLSKIDESVFYGASELNDVTIPNGFTEIGDYAFYGTKSLTNLTIPNSVTSIGSFSFYDSGITSINIPNGVTELPYSVFYGAINLTTISIGSNVTSIGKEAFGNMKNLKSINVNGSNNNFSSDNGVLFNKDKTTLIKYPEGKTDTTYTVPSTVKVLDVGAFFQASNLKTINLPDGLTNIKQQAFAAASKLETLAIPNSVTEIAEGVLYGAINLKSLTISLNHLDKDNFNKKHFGYIFGRVNFEESYLANDFRIPSKLKTINLIGDATINKDSFINMSSIETLTIASTFTKIEKGALKGLSKLSKLTVPFIGGSMDGVDEAAYLGYIFGTESFTDSYEIYHPEEETQFYIPSSLSEIDVLEANEIVLGAFSGIRTLTTVNLPFIGKNKDALNVEGLFGYIFGTEEYTGSYASYHPEDEVDFYIPTLLKNITIKDVSVIVDRAFYNLKNIEVIELPQNVSTLGMEAFSGLERLKEIIVDTNNNSYSTVSGILFNKDQTTLIKYPEAKFGASYTLPATVTEIADRAFEGVRGLTKLEVSDQITTIGEDAFLGMSGLREINIAAENSQYSSVDGILFNKDQTTLIKFPEAKVSEEYVMPSSVTTLHENAFRYTTKLTKLDLANVEVIKDGALKDMLGLKTLIINNEDLVLPEGVFNGASALISITVPFVGNSKDANGVESYFGFIFGTEEYIGSYASFHPEEDVDFYIPTTLKEVEIIKTNKINEAVFNGIRTLTKMTLPFVGGSEGADGVEAYFGYIFGTTLFQGGYTTYHPEEDTMFYVPAALREVILTEAVTIADYAFKDVRTLSKVVIPETVVNMGEKAFELIKNVTFHIDLLEKPESWNEDWNIEKRPVVWKS